MESNARPDLVEFQILVNGYARRTNTGWVASPNTVLLKSGKEIILADPGCNPKLLKEGLERIQLKPDEITLIFLTHTHIDHFLNIRDFPHIPIYEGSCVYRNDEAFFNPGSLPGTNIQVIPTSGHSEGDTSLIFPSSFGKTALVGDLLWWEDGEQPYPIPAASKLIDIPDILAYDDKALKQHRKFILSQVDYIIPGHGKGFPVIKDI